MHIRVSIREQRLWLSDGNGKVILDTSVATARNGPGERINSECTPRGSHVIRAMIGRGCPENTVFRGRRPTGEIYASWMKKQYPERDWILTRIMWLSGSEVGLNRLGDVDTMRRYIYIHGSPADDVMGVPSSHGCVKMTNADVIALFEQVDTGTPVTIEV